MNPKNAHGVSDWTSCETIFAQRLKALEAEEKRISPSRGFHGIEKAQIAALPFSGDLGPFNPQDHSNSFGDDPKKTRPKDPSSDPFRLLVKSTMDLYATI